jgi:hypothetical protein
MTCNPFCTYCFEMDWAAATLDSRFGQMMTDSCDPGAVFDGHPCVCEPAA